MDRTHRFPAEPAEPNCDGCGKQGVSYRLTVTSILRPAAQRHRHYCITCWLTIKRHLSISTEGASVP